MHLPNFERAATAFLRDTVRVSAGAQSSRHGVLYDALLCSIQSSAAIQDEALLGLFSDSTDLMFCRARTAEGLKVDIRKEDVIEDMPGTGTGRRYLVTNDPADYAGMFQVVPLRAARV